MNNLNQRNLAPWTMEVTGHGFVTADIFAWGGCLIRHDGANWVKGTELPGERGTACLVRVVDLDNIRVNTLPDDAEMETAVGNLTDHALYYPAANGDVDTTVNGTPVLRHMGDGLVQFYDAHEPEPVVYSKLRLTATRVVNAGETLSLSGPTKGEADGTAGFSIDADRNADITLKATAPEHNLDDEILFTGNRSIYAPDDFVWQSTTTVNVPERYDIGDRIDIKQRV